MTEIYLGGSKYFDESTGQYTNGYSPQGKTSATPDIPQPVPTSLGTSIKVATPDLIQFNEEAIPIEYMTDLLFEQVGGQEIISISRNDIVNGQQVLYRPIKNIPQVSASFSPLNMFAAIDDTNSYFKNFVIQFDTKVPEVGSDSSANEVSEVIYIDDTNGNLVINTINMLADEVVEVQVLTSGGPVGDIIY